MNIKTKEVEQLKITDSEGLDPITVYMDEWQKEKDNGDTQFQGRITIVCYDTILSYYWESMGAPLKEFFTTANAEYLLGKFVQTSYSSYCPVAYTTEVTESGRFFSKEIDVSIEMSDTQKVYLLKIIKAVQEGIRELLEKEMII